MISVLSLATRQMACNCELRASIEPAEYRFIETADDNKLLFRFEPHDPRGGLAC
jgi:hypothetical protein